MSSNKNWPSMFKSKPCNNNHHNHDINAAPYMHYNCNTSSPFSSARVPDPKPRWNPKPEQIRILESIFNSGIVNPPRDEIQRIRIRLQEYGQIGDANVFYWFQNRKSRAKHKLRVLQKNPKLSKKDKIVITPSDADSCFDLVNKETGLFPVQNNEVVITEPNRFLFPVHNDPSVTLSGFGDFAVPVVTEQRMEFPGVSNGVSLEIPEINFDGGENGYSSISVPVTVPSTINQSQVFSGDGDVGACVSPGRLTVFINDMPFEVIAGLFNVKDAFGKDAVLINSFGQPILTDEFGVTFQPLQNGAVYYLI
ncbi:unnamed protein product [Arabis nemorensis]|uniref:Homeobox domain-containing protein n=1 Tax=Arabis nemorensis TaxID=586526 RepID=A0A565C3E2_9BRAS|nr:unnamed protein product [Arabis nemorensis]